MESQEIIFTDLPKYSTNQIYAGIHYRVRKTHKDTYRLLTRHKMLTELVECDEKVDLNFIYYFGKNSLDSSNTTYMSKLIEDCLVESGVLKNDGPKYVGWFNNISKKNPNGETNHCHLRISKHKEYHIN